MCNTANGVCHCVLPRSNNDDSTTHFYQIGQSGATGGSGTIAISPPHCPLDDYSGRHVYQRLNDYNLFCACGEIKKVF